MKDITLPEEAYRQQIKEWTDYDKMECKADPKDYDTYRKLVKLGVKKGWPEALEALGYGSYGGNNVFPEDWATSEKCLLKLIATVKNPSPFYYNTLGYIYYYGRTTGGKPDYVKAYQYFSVAAVHGVYEAMYKLADMLIAGKGVPKNEEAAALLIERVVRETRDLIELEKYECKFADAALRLGRLFEDGIGREPNIELAYSMYLQADFAIKKRMEEGSWYGDRVVKQNIQKALKKVEEKLPEGFYKTRISGEAPFLVGALLESSQEGIEVSLTSKDGENYLLARLVEPEEEPLKKHLFSFPELKFVDVTDTVVMRVDGLENVKSLLGEEWAYVNHIERNEKTNYWEFYSNADFMLMIRCKGFSFEV
ncbi:MAG: sel1 repeat family protein [Lachnospiraceae bacterium]|nr:sel1 repeat family protein [Lachnospiraceae bacterium]